MLKVAEVAGEPHALAHVGRHSTGKVLYRGYDIEHTADGWIVTKSGERRAKARTEQAAIDFVDIVLSQEPEVA